MTTIQGVLHGQRCRTCKGAVRWRNAGFGERPSHIWAQDFADARGQTHPAILEAGEPTHYWSPGHDGGPDVKVDEASGESVGFRHVRGPRTDNVEAVEQLDTPTPAPVPPGPLAVDTANTPLTPEGPDDAQ